MYRHINCLLLHDRVIKGLQKSSCAPIPSKLFMQRYRHYNRPEKYGARAANGEPAAMYGMEGDQVPWHVATADDEALQPLAQFIRDRLMKPVIRYMLKPSKKLLHKLPSYKRELPGGHEDFEDVYEETLNAIANVCVYVVATMILIAPIAIFNTVQQQTLRIVIVPLFCLLLVASAQLMGPGSMPLFTLVTSFFQTMVVFVAVTGDQ
ncbi:hypothetical protein DDE82_001306 [Stemphylium lycopersici]|nr:hypothetical protein DDE82_001306 [Stemphylium lycopersici]